MREPMTRKPNVGEKITYVGDGFEYLTRGEEYEVIGIDSDGDVVVYDDDHDREYITREDYGNFEIDDSIPDNPGFIAVDVKVPADADGISLLHVQVDSAGLKTLLDLEARHDKASKAAEIKAEIQRLQDELKKL